MAQRAPFVSLWSRDDVRAAVVDFLPTKAVAARKDKNRVRATAFTPGETGVGVSSMTTNEYA